MEIEIKALKPILVAVIGATAVSLLYPPINFPLLMAILAGIFVFAIFKMVTARDAGVAVSLLLVVGMITVGVMATEVGHATVGYISPDLKITGFGVSLIEWNENQSNVSFGYTVLQYDENLMANPQTAPALQSQLLNTILAGGVVLALISALFFISPTPTNGPALLWMLMLLSHNLPIYANDTSRAVSAGWANAWWAWGTFFILFIPVLLAMAYSLRRGDDLI